MLIPLYVSPLNSGAVTPQPAVPGSVRAVAFKADGTSVADFIPLTVLSFQLDAYCNRIGNWQILCAVDAGISTATSQPFGAQIQSGWKITMYVEGSGPYGIVGQPILVNGIVTKREYQIAEGGAALMLSGSSFAWPLTLRQMRPQSYGAVSGPTATNAPVQAIVDGIAGSHIPVPSFANAAITVDVNGGSAYNALLAAGELARLTLRETWQGTLEFTAIDGAPDSGWTITGVEEVTPELYI